MVKQIQLDYYEASSYIRDCLSQGGRLANSLLQLPLERGRVTTFLPETVSEKASREFAVGGVTQSGPSRSIPGGVVIPVPRTETAAALVVFMRHYLSGAGKRYIVFESPTARSGDPWLATTELQFFTHGPLVCYFFTADYQDRTMFLKARTFASFPFVGLLTSLPDESPSIENRQETTDDMLRLLLDRTEHILVGAYDNEGELIWDKPHVISGEQVTQ